MTEPLAPAADLDSDSQRLAEQLAGRSDRLAHAWSARLRGDSRAGPWPVAQGDLEQWARAGIEALIASLRGGSHRPLARHLGAAGSDRAVDLERAVDSLLLLREVVDQQAPAGSGAGSRAPLDRCLHGALTEFAAVSAEAERNRTGLMLEVAEATGGSLDLEEVLPRIARGILRALGASACGIFLWDPRRERFEPRLVSGEVATEVLRGLFERTLSPRRDSLVARALAERGPAVCRSGMESCVLVDSPCQTLGIGAAAVLPIILADRVLALVLAVQEDPHYRFRPAQLDLARGVTRVVAPAMDNARRFAEAQSLLGAGHRLNRATAALLEMRGLDDVLTIVCREARGLLGAEGSAVLVAEPRSGPRLAKALGIDAVRARELVEMAAGGDSRAVAVPLRVEGELFGTLVIETPRGECDEGDLRILEQFADRAALAIEHALLHQRRELLAAAEERQRVAHELHDSVTQSLYGATMYGEAASRHLAAGEIERASELLREMRRSSLEALRETRMLLFELRPSALRGRGLAAALEARLAAVEKRGGMQAVLRATNTEGLPDRVAAALYGIAKEALNNALKHSGAGRVEVTVGVRDGLARLEILDDGRGFSVAEARARGGLGLVFMEERATELGGRLEVTSRPGEGARVRVELPLTGRDEGRS